MQRQSLRTMMEEAPPPEVKKIEGRSSLPRKLEDPEFRKAFILNRPVPVGRNIWSDNPRLEIRLPDDPLEYTWPEGHDFADYDPVLKRSWEDEMFEMKWNGATSKPVQGGDWANFRISKEVPPRIKIYYANIVQRFRDGRLMSATKVFNLLLSDYLAPRGSIPYGVYHTMLVVYKQRERYERALEMFNEIVSYHTPTPDDYALGMEVLLHLNMPREALEVWQSFGLRPSLKPNANMYTMLLRTYARLGDDQALMKTFAAAESEAKSRAIKQGSTALSSSVTSPLDFLPIFTSMLEIYAELGYVEEFEGLVSSMTSQYPLLTKVAALKGYSTLNLHNKVLQQWKSWFDGQDLGTHFGMGARPYLPVLKALLLTGDIKELENTITRLQSKNLSLDLDILSLLISNRLALGENSRLTSLVNDAMSLKDIRPSIRAYRAVRAANVSSSASTASGDALGTARTSVGELESMRIEVDAGFLDALMQAYSRHNDLSSAVALWRKDVIERNLVPLRSSFTHFFTLAGQNGDHVTVALAWKLAQALHITPDRGFASALALGLQPDRNHFGRTDTRKLHQKWTTLTGNSTARVLNKTELAEYSAFIKHAISTFTESDKKRLDKEWAEMYATFTTPVVEEVVVQDTPAARPVDNSTTTIRRIFADKRTKPGQEPIEPAEAVAASTEANAQHPVAEAVPEPVEAPVAPTPEVVTEKTE